MAILLGSLSGGMQPTAPTIGTATGGDTTASVAFTPSTYIGKGTITYTATSSPGGLTATGASSPLTVTGLTNGTAYTFTVVGNTNYGVASAASAASNSITPAALTSYQSIATAIVPAGGATYVEFTSIPQTFTHLEIRATTLNASNFYTIKLRFNGDTGNNYPAAQLATFNPTNVSGSGPSNDTGAMIGVGARNATYYSAISVAKIYEYSLTNLNKRWLAHSGADGNGTGQTKNTFGWWNNTAAINSIYCYADGSTMNEYTQFSLYGIKGA